MTETVTTSCWQIQWGGWWHNGNGAPGAAGDVTATERLGVSWHWDGWRCHGNGAAGDTMAMGHLGQLVRLVMTPPCGSWRCYGNGAAGDITAMGQLAILLESHLVNFALQW